MFQDPEHIITKCGLTVPKNSKKIDAYKNTVDNAQRALNNPQVAALAAAAKKSAAAAATSQQQFTRIRKKI